MSTCTFFGHRECPTDIRPKLRELSEDYPHIRYAVVLERFPEKCGVDCSDTILPEGIEEAPRRFAVDRRNQWMLRQSDMVVCYVTHSWGGAAKYAETAKRQKKSVFNLAGR